MTFRYAILGIVQLLFIATCGWLRHKAWPDIDFLDGPGALPPLIQYSFYCLAGWFSTIAFAIGLAVTDKRNRSMIVLFLIVVFPFIELLALLMFAW